jgi:hypothetical protein
MTYEDYEYVYKDPIKWRLLMFAWNIWIRCFVILKNMVFKDGYERYILKIIMVGESDIQIGL